jgi:hypothetical protein
MVLFNGTLSVVELLMVIASKSPYLADRVLFSTASGFYSRLGFSIVKIGLSSLVIVVCCTTDLHAAPVRGWPYLRN